MKNQRYTTNTKTNNKNIFAIMVALWFFVVMSISQLCITVFTHKANAAPAQYADYDIMIKTDMLGLTTSDFATLKSAGWNAASTEYKQSDFAGYLYKSVGNWVAGEGSTMDTTQVDLPIAILESICGTIQLKATIGGVEIIYTNSDYVMSGYTFSDFSSTRYVKGTSDAYILFVGVVKSKNTLNLTINFENIQYQGTSVPLYVFDNDTNDILSVTSVVQSASSTPINIDFDASTTVRITLAVPYLWEIEWTNVEKFVNKSAIVDVSGEVVISAKVKVVSSYNNIIIV